MRRFPQLKTENGKLCRTRMAIAAQHYELGCTLMQPQHVSTQSYGTASNDIFCRLCARPRKNVSLLCYNKQDGKPILTQRGQRRFDEQGHIALRPGSVVANAGMAACRRHTLRQCQ
jgi:hypothetical protein